MLEGDDLKGMIRVLCDTGAQVNLIQRACVRRLGVQIQPAQLTIKGVGGRNAMQSLGTIKLKLHTRFGESLNIEAAFHVVPKLSAELPRTKQLKMTQQFASDELADPEYDLPAPIDGILGVGVMAQIMHGETASLRSGYLAQQTALGRIIFGADADIGDAWVATATAHESSEEQLDELLKYMWAKEDPPGEGTVEDIWCERNFMNTYKRDVDGRFVVSIPMRPRWQEKLGESRRMAERRFYQLEARLLRYPELQREYVQFMREYEQLNHMQKAQPRSNRQSDAIINYIPHHALAPPRKFRVVFDASATTTSGRSFNQMQYAGPRLYDNLDVLITRFRMGRYAMTADVCKMFRQIRILPEQYDLQRILWRETPNEPLREYQLTVVTYGTASAPYLAQRAMMQCANEYASEYPLGAEIVRRNFYVDDMLYSTNERQQLREGKRQIAELLSKGCLELAKWNTNLETDKSIMNAQVSIGDDPIGLLGLYWTPTGDTLKFKRIPSSDERAITKRTIVSQVAKLYDPSGFVGPVIVHMRAFIQQLWKLKLKWDKEVDEALKQQWLQMQEALPRLDQVKIPRWLGSPASQVTQHKSVHIFCDASRTAYGAVAYMRNEMPDGTATCNIIASRAYVAGVKGMTIPRLELKGAVIAAHLAESIRSATASENIDFYYWTDSEVVMYWIRRPSDRAKVFVANRVAEIQASTNVTSWHHVTTKENPADVLSRGASVDALLKNNMWWNGPGFLHTDFTGRLSDKEDKWHQAEKEALVEYNKEAATADVNLIECGDLLLIDRFSSLEKVLRITAYVLRFIKRCRKRLSTDVLVVQTRAARRAAESTNDDSTTTANTESPPPLTTDNSLFTPATVELSSTPANDLPFAPTNPEPTSTMEAEEQSSQSSNIAGAEPSPMIDDEADNSPSVDEREEALKCWIRITQQESYGQEYAALQRGDNISRTSKILEMAPFLDADKILRARGRLKESTLSYDQKHPIILPASATLTQRLIRIAHHETLHGGVQLIMHNLREHYWIPRLRQAVRQFNRSCMVCRRHQHITAEQLMADLPGERVQQSKPFANCGVDFAGPIKIKSWSGRSAPICLKAYIAVFICLATKAIHLELVSDLTSKAFIDALDRMMSRRGRVERMWSDNGTTFIGACRALLERLIAWMGICKELREELRSRRMEWSFITPLAPHHGGLWEAAVKSVKYHLVRIIGKSSYTFEQLSTLLARVEACLNSRPLTALTDDPNDLTALTPAHFLGVSPAMSLLDEANQQSSDPEGNISASTKEIWKRWHEEYLTSLNNRTKWRNENTNLKEGELVILKVDNSPPSHWPLARIVKVHPSSDGLVRSVTVRTESGMYRRPIVKCCRLPSYSESEVTRRTT